ncbi:MFS transporter [Solimonas sp. K1W22B-7]|uniref:AmpG family muropeptide MFS transporter n=1 Tax=Solimonas sp. K1W22B-7 TaxID=2303331 RepID=UPI000E3324D3|nr:MFS transporter [Solimonas sp. K1W22B-7]AXQ31041.1 MFS transporter [Solimonas sp. K1W22B-7]
MTSEAAPRGWRDALRMYGHPRVASMLFLGFSAGLPFLLVFSTLSAWLAQAGVQRATIGMLSWVGITYSIKFFWAPVVDRLALPGLTRLLGRRRSWMLLAQVGLACGLAGLALHDPATQLRSMVYCALLVAFSSATQDIAIDAWRIEAAEQSLQGNMSAAYQLGYRIALIVAGAGALFLAAEQGWQMSYLTMAALVGVGVVTTLLIAEPEQKISRATLLQEERVLRFIEQRQHWPEGLRHAGAWVIGAVVCPFVDFFQRNGWKLGALILCFVGLFRLTDITMGVMANPFYLSLGYTLKQIAAIAKGYGVVMSILGAFLGGLAVARWGALRALLIGGVVVILSNLCFALLALHGQPSIEGLALVISADNLAAGLAGSAFIAYLSGLTNTAYTATQYALFSSLFTLPGKLMGGASGWVVDQIGFVGFFLYTSALGLPALLILLQLNRRLPAPSAAS